MLHFLCRCSYLFTFLLSSQFYRHIRLKSTADFLDPPCIRDGNGNGYFFVRAKIPIGRFTLVILGARYGQFDVTRELPDRTHWLGIFQM